MTQTLGLLPAEAARRWGDRPALVFQGRRWSFAQVEDEVERAARALVAAGVQPGDKVALWLMNRPEWLFLFYAVARVEAVLVPLNTRFREDDVRYVVGHSQAALLIQNDVSGPIDFLAMTRAALPGPDGARVVTVGARTHEGVLHWDALLATVAAAPPAEAAALAAEVARRAAAVSPEDTSMIVYTSGTTGFPKGAMHSHRCIKAQRERAALLGVTEDDVFLCYLPLFHLYGLAEMGLMFTVTGSCCVLTEGFDPDESVRLIEQERVTMVHGFDVHYLGLLEARERLGADTSSLRLGSFPAGSDSSYPVVRRAHRELVPIVSAYGLTEGWCCVAIGRTDGSEEQRCLTSGMPMPGYELRIHDPARDEDVPLGEPGEILVRSELVMQGYYREPALTADTVDADGWLHTGDMGTLRPDGYVRFLGRYKDMLKVGGENVSPLEVEGYLLERHPLRQVAIVGAPDPRLDEVPVAFVEALPECALTAEELEQAVIESCRGHIASFKIPRRVVVVDALPMTASGKVQKHKLRDLARDLLPPSR